MPIEVPVLEIKPPPAYSMSDASLIGPRVGSLLMGAGGKYGQMRRKAP